MSHCYAFKGRGCHEPMHEHVSGIVECMRGRWEFRALAKKLWHLFGIDEGLVEDMLLSAALLHDVGKALVKFQKRCSDEGCTEFRCHHVTSARFAVTVGVEAGLLPQDPLRREELFNSVLGGRLEGLDERALYVALVVTPVLLHHYAQVKEEAYFECDSPDSFIMDSACGSVYARLTESIGGYPLTDTGRGIVKAVLKCVTRAVSGSLGLALLPLRKDAALSYELAFTRALAEAATGLLNMCDGRVAYVGRRGCK